MKIFIIKENKKLIKFFVFLFWILIWQIGSVIINQEILLVSPISVAKKLTELVKDKDFYLTIFNSFINIIFGFLLGVFFSILFAILASKSYLLKIIIEPIVILIKSMPIVSIIILAIIYIKAKNLSIFISFLIVFPIIYTNILEGIKNTNKKLIEMAKTFNVKKIKKIIYIYVIEVYPYFISGITITLGLCWKAGISGEVIGIVKNSFGEKLYLSKLYLDTAELFAWTIVIIFVSYIFEKLVLFLVKKIPNLIDRKF